MTASANYSDIGMDKRHTFRIYGSFVNVFSERYAKRNTGMLVVGTR